MIPFLSFEWWGSYLQDELEREPSPPGLAICSWTHTDLAFLLVTMWRDPHARGFLFKRLDWTGLAVHLSKNLDHNMEAKSEERKVFVMSEPRPSASKFIFCRWMCRWNMKQWHHVGGKLECVLHSGKRCAPTPWGAERSTHRVRGISTYPNPPTGSPFPVRQVVPGEVKWRCSV